MTPPPPKKQKKTVGVVKKASKKKEKEVKPASAEYADKRGQEYQKGFKADKRYAKRHNALMFVERGPFNWTKLHFAVWRNDLNSVKNFVEYHQTTKPDVLLKTGQWGETALQLALRLERAPEMIKELLRGAGAEAVNMNLEEYYFKDIDNEDLWYGMCYYPIHEAVCYKKHDHALEVTRLLLDNDADEEQGDYNDITPLSLAASNGHRDVLELLISKGARLSFRDETMALHMAVGAPKEKDAIACLKYLFSLDGCHVDQRDSRFGKTALHSACDGFRVGVVEYLLKAGADVNVADKNGQTALNLLHKKALYSCNSNRVEKEYPLIKSLFEKYSKK